MLYCSLVTCLVSFAIGYVIGSPNIIEAAIRGLPGGQCGSSEVLPYSIQNGFPNCLYFSDLVWGFAVGSFALGACAGGLTGGAIQNKHGRVRAMLITDLVFVVGSAVIGLSYHQAQLILGRIIVGFACGLGGVVAPTYLGEIATVESKGTMGALHQLFLVTGLLASNLAGLAWSSPPGWRIVLALNGAPALVQLLLLPTIVESPRYLILKGRTNDAHESMQVLRKGFEEKMIKAEFSEAVEFLLGPAQGAAQSYPPPVERMDSSATVTIDTAVAAPTTATELESKGNNPSSAMPETLGVIDLFRSESCRGLATIGVAIHFLQQATGISGLVYYSTSFLGAAFGADNSKLITVGVVLISVVVTILSVYLVDRINRRPLLIASFAGIGFSSILLVAGAYANVSSLVAVAVFMYFAAFALAMGPIPWLIISELLPTYALSAGSSAATTTNWGTNFVIGLLFPMLTKSMGNATFILFGATSFFGAFFVWRWVPETRNRTVEQVMAQRRPFEQSSV
ncbi:hypothetical protein BG006_000062 [Podila minutissima]|uniref:Major facilitator superfamily (MFS) profile domain-containing protein n=1 Tax=Podila minutissima TaxID=64525 RepID=A0A9P5VRC4_9FUNG|nr:hypothetical protein BG006_000062 [Podila minutissima]